MKGQQESNSFTTSVTSRQKYSFLTLKLNNKNTHTEINVLTRRCVNLISFDFNLIIFFITELHYYIYQCYNK
jgi:hypothetical protein